jgi:hypothetical protein
MTDLYVGFDPTQPVGSRFVSSLVITEIGAVAPNAFLPGSITQTMLAAGCVTQNALAAGCVTSPALATDSVTTAAIAPNAVGAAQLAPNAVTVDNLAPGVPNATDHSGNPIALTLVILTAAQYSALSPPAANSLYFITD